MGTQKYEVNTMDQVTQSLSSAYLGITHATNALMAQLKAQYGETFENLPRGVENRTAEMELFSRLIEIRSNIQRQWNVAEYLGRR